MPAVIYGIEWNIWDRNEGSQQNIRKGIKALEIIGSRNEIRKEGIRVQLRLFKLVSCQQ